MPDSTYRLLQPEKLVETTELLERRISERFPDAGLVGAAKELHRFAQDALIRSQQIRQPYLLLRCVIGVLVSAIIIVLIILAMQLRVRADELFKFEQFVQAMESLMGALFFIGATIVFLVTLERRWKREKALSAIHELRSLAHIVDMHQLTKDPESTIRGGPRTPSSPKRNLGRFELTRYLDYCSEMLSIISKIGATYVQEFHDEAALEAVDQLANLTNGLSRSIWQKIILLDQNHLPDKPPESPAESPPPPSPKLAEPS